MDEILRKKLERQLVKDGLLIEAGWVSLRHLTLPENVSTEQLDDMRDSFFAGAQHVFGTIMSLLDEGEDATAADLIRLDQINDELQRFIVEYKHKHNLLS